MPNAADVHASKTRTILSGENAVGEFSFLVPFLLLGQKKKEQVTFGCQADNNRCRTEEKNEKEFEGKPYIVTKTSKSDFVLIDAAK